MSTQTHIYILECHGLYLHPADGASIELKLFNLESLAPKYNVNIIFYSMFLVKCAAEHSFNSKFGSTVSIF